MGSRWLRSVARLVTITWILSGSPVLAGGDECFYCGMGRSDHGHSWVEVHYPETAVHGFCSLHCASIHLALNPDSVPERILVGDYTTQRMIDADTAHWVIGGRQPGVMTARAKWAFAEKQDAVQFMTQYGGSPATASEAIRAAVDDMYSDIRVIQKKREAARTRTMDQNRE